VNDDTLRDPESGLLNGDFFRAALPHRVATARRVLRPFSVALLALGDGEGRAVRATAELAEQVAYGLLETLRESDTPCRLWDGTFGVLLEDTPESGAVWTVERLRRLLADQGLDVTVWAGIASYPAHALEAREVLARAEAALQLAREWTQSRIEVALPE
jgi:GGDEF domain-containing protein